MKIKNIIEQVEHVFGRQAEGYVMRLINDGLADMSIKKQHYKKDFKVDLVENQRWYDLPDELIDITRVEILTSGNPASCSNSSYTTQASCESAGETWTTASGQRYVLIPKLADPHKLLREDEY